MGPEVQAFLHGEGKGDLGQMALGQFQPGPCFMLLQAASRLKLDPTYVTKEQIAQTGRQRPVLPRPSRPTGTGFFYKNSWALAKWAAGISSEGRHLCVFFRDSDGTNSSPSSDWQAKFDSVVQGFQDAGCRTGVAMLPKPKSEAWFLCALKGMDDGTSLEGAPGNDSSPNSLKKQLAGLLKSRDMALEAATLSQLVDDGEITPDRIPMPSFRAFQKSLREAEASWNDD